MQQYGNYSGMRLERVSNFEEARRYQLYPNGYVYLLDQEQPYIYLKYCDQTGKTSLRAFSLIEVDPSKITDSKYITKDDFDAFKQDILNTLKKGTKENE